MALPALVTLSRILALACFLRVSEARSSVGSIESIQVSGLNETQVMQSQTFSLHITGSYPLALCWLIKTDCVQLEGNDCHLVVINSTVYNLNYTFKDPGQYCLSIKVQNGINQLYHFHQIKVRPASIHPALFVMPCVLLVAGMLSFIMYVTYRNSTQQKDLVEVLGDLHGIFYRISLVEMMGGRKKVYSGQWSTWPILTFPLCLTRARLVLNLRDAV